MAAICSMIAFGSFGVPIKSDASNSVDVDPLVFQSYKSFLCFATAWLVLLTGQVEFSFTPWGIVSCIFWVPGGVATVYAIRNAGLAIAIGVGSSSIVLVSFTWGIFIFQEPVYSISGACLAIAMMIVGLIGMSYYSSSSSIGGVPMENNRMLEEEEETGVFRSMSHDAAEQQQEPMTELQSTAITTTAAAEHRRRPNNRGYYQGVDSQPISSTQSTAAAAMIEGDEGPGSLSTTASKVHDTMDGIRTTDRTVILSDDGFGSSFSEHNTDEFENGFPNDLPPPARAHRRTGPRDPFEIIYICGLRVTRRQVGISAAVFNGVWGGSIMAPMHFCKDNSQTSGVGYLISFGIGAALVTMALWLFRYGYWVLYFGGNPSRAYQALPSFHLPILWLPGGTSGLLWSIGNFFSLISVYYLGEGVGYSVVQAGMLGTYGQYDIVLLLDRCITL
jgi:hypothetical protein